VIERPSPSHEISQRLRYSVTRAEVHDVPFASGLPRPLGLTERPAANVTTENDTLGNVRTANDTAPNETAPNDTAPHSGPNIATMWEAIADAQPEAPALVRGSIRRSWSEFDRRCDGVAETLLSYGVQRQDKVAQYLRSCPEYVEALFACFKAGLVPVNTNYRYVDGELESLWSNADVVVVVFGAEFSEVCNRLRQTLPQVRTWMWVGSADERCPEWALRWEDAAAVGSSRVEAPWGRSGDDLLLMYTGGTTGMPKGVMWPQRELIGALEQTRKSRLPPASAAGPPPPPVHLPGAPLMHGTGQFNAINNLLAGGSVVTTPSRSFDPAEVLDAIDVNGVTTMSIVGDVFARPIVDCLAANPGRWNLSSLQVVVSSGVMWSADVKESLMVHMPGVRLVDSLGSSEAIGMASSITSSTVLSPTATFTAAAHTQVIDDDGSEIVAGSGMAGRVALSGFMPSGYYKDPQATAKTFVVVEGVRRSLPGDWATVASDGTIEFLGRGSQCINTGGEKVYPEEVEEILKLHPGVFDAAVIGMPDERFGQSILALVELRLDATASQTELITHVRRHVAAYKSPRRIVIVPSLGRAANGKLDYQFLNRLGSSAVPS